MKEQTKCGNCAEKMDGATCRVCGFENPLVTNAVRNFETARKAWRDRVPQTPEELAKAFAGNLG